MNKKVDSPRASHPIQVVARRTGLTADVLRAWERRYSAITPARTEGSRRLYSDEDIERLSLLRRATQLGRSIGQIAGLPTDQLRALVEADEAGGPFPGAPAPAPSIAASPPSKGVSAHSRRALSAVRDLDAQALEAALGHALVAHGPTVVMEEILIPLMHEIGSAWQDGKLSIVHEHLASAVTRTFVGSLARRQPPAGTAPAIVVATPTGQRHELGALIAAVTALSAGWESRYLGPDLPASEIAAGARACGAKAVALGISFPGSDPRVAEALVGLRETLPHCPILVGGIAAGSYAKTLDAIGAETLDGMDPFRDALARLAG